MLATPPEFIALTPEMKERLDRFQEDHKNDPLGLSLIHISEPTRPY